VTPKAKAPFENLLCLEYQWPGQLRGRRTAWRINIRIQELQTERCLSVYPCRHKLVIQLPCGLALSDHN
jgi:hypothetical protein